MKNFLYSNYGIKVDKIYKNDKEMFFFCNNEKIHIRKNNDINHLNMLYELTNYLYSHHIPTYTFIHNNKNKPYTHLNKNEVVLLKENNNNDYVSLNTLNMYRNIKTKLYNYNIFIEWSNEVDLIEKELMEYNKEYPLIQESIDYFIGLAENAIELIGNFKNMIDANNNSIGHIVDYNLLNNMSINDPFTFIKTNIMFDYANYIKYKYVLNEIDYNELDSIFNSLSEYESIYLLSCLIYPSTYFSLVKSILLKKEEEEKLIFIIKKIDNHNQLLLFCKSRVKSKVISNLLSWI